MNDGLSQALVEALGATREGESWKAWCPVHQPGGDGGKPNLFILPSGADGLPTFKCHDGCAWPQLRPALLRCGVPAELLRGAAVAPDEGDPWPEPDQHPLPSEEDLARWTAALLSGRWPDFLRYLHDECDLSERQIAEEGLGARSFNGRNPRIILPVRDAAGRLVAVRLLNPHHPQQARRKTWWPGHGGAFLLGAHRLAGWAGSEPVLVCEGESDYLAATAAGFNAVAVTAGASAVPRDLSPLRGRRVVVCFDADKPGRDGADKLAQSLRAEKAVTFIADLAGLGDGIDLREALRAGHDVAAVVERAQLWTFDEALIRQQAHVELVRRRARRRADEGEARSTWEEPPSFRTMREELAQPDAPPAWTVESLHPTGHNSLVIAPYKVGKTTLLLNLMRSLVDGTAFLDAYVTAVPAGRRVAWWNFELDARQARRWVREMGIVNLDKLCHLPLRGFRLPIASEFVIAWVVQWMVEREVAVLVIDPFGAAYDGDENDNAAVRDWLAAIDQIKRRAGIQDVFLVVHTGRAEQHDGAERARGATRLEDWADGRWMYTAERAVPDLRFLRAHGRDVDVPQTAVEYEPSRRILRLHGGSPMSRGEAALASRVDRVASAVSASPGINGGNLRSRVGGGKAEVDQAVAEAIARGRIRTEKGPYNATRHYPTDEQIAAQTAQVADARRFPPKPNRRARSSSPPSRREANSSRRARHQPVQAPFAEGESANEETTGEEQP